MKRFSLIVAFVVGPLLSVTAWADPRNEQAELDTVTIPLDQIWAYHMPGTKDIRELEPEQRPEYLETLPPEEQRELLAKRLWIPIALSLCADSSPHWPREGQIARPGFAVLGTGREALQEANAVLAKGEKARESFPLGSEVTLVFFSYQMQSNVHLHHVGRSEHDIELQYRIEPFVERHLAAHAALIPLGKLRVGKYTVATICLPLERRLVAGERKDAPSETARRFVSGGFSFDVVEEN